MNRARGPTRYSELFYTRFTTQNLLLYTCVKPPDAPERPPQKSESAPGKIDPICTPENRARTMSQYTATSQHAGAARDREAARETRCDPDPGGARSGGSSESLSDARRGGRFIFFLEFRSFWSHVLTNTHIGHGATPSSATRIRPLARADCDTRDAPRVLALGHICWCYLCNWRPLCISRPDQSEYHRYEPTCSSLPTSWSWCRWCAFGLFTL